LRRASVSSGRILATDFAKAQSAKGFISSTDLASLIYSSA
jgi:hypothetical protein